MAEAILIVVAALMLSIGGLVAVSDDGDIYPRVRWLCGFLAALGAVLLALVVHKVLTDG